MITFAEVKASPRERDTPMEDLELAISKLIDGYRNKSPKADAVNALKAQAELVNRDDSWTADSEEAAKAQQDAADKAAADAKEKQTQEPPDFTATEPGGEDPTTSKKKK